MTKKTEKKRKKESLGKTKVTNLSRTFADKNKLHKVSLKKSKLLQRQFGIKI
jgi:hypothetical protein